MWGWGRSCIVALQSQGILGRGSGTGKRQLRAPAQRSVSWACPCPWVYTEEKLEGLPGSLGKWLDKSKPKHSATMKGRKVAGRLLLGEKRWGTQPPFLGSVRNHNP